MKRAERNEYSVPMLEVQELEVERGFFVSSDYGDYGEAGQKSGYIDSDSDFSL
ncbi:MAG: hypothetical protein IKA04_08530 [Alistipes sp.]|nr:hypothetical protein [Alistipes sp.]